MSASKLQRWEIKASTGSHFDMLDGLRGVAILLVAAFHTLYTNPAHGALARAAGYMIAGGWMGVPVFFVLSGFLISYPFFQKREADPQFWYQRGYAFRRMAKILPPFYLSILLFMAFYWFNYHDPAYFHSALMWATGLGNFISISPNFNGVYWSLMVESHFYIVLPVLFLATRGISGVRTGVIIFLILFWVSLIARHLAWPENLFTLPDFTSPVYADAMVKNKRFPCQLDFFAWGILFAALFCTCQKNLPMDRLKPLAAIGYVGVTLMTVSLFYWGLWEHQFDIRTYQTQWSMEVSHLLPSVSVMLLLFFLFDRQCLGSRLLSMNWLRFIGIISYEWFLFHGPIVHWFQSHTGPSQGNLLAFAGRTFLPLALTFGFSVLVYRWFSLPLMNRVRNHLKRPGSSSREHTA